MNYKHTIETITGTLDKLFADQWQSPQLRVAIADVHATTDGQAGTHADITARHAELAAWATENGYLLQHDETSYYVNRIVIKELTAQQVADAVAKHHMHIMFAGQPRSQGGLAMISMHAQQTAVSVVIFDFKGEQWGVALTGSTVDARKERIARFVECWHAGQPQSNAPKAVDEIPPELDGATMNPS